MFVYYYKAQFCLAQACETGRSMEVKAMLEAPKVDINFPNVVSELNYICILIMNSRLKSFLHLNIPTTLNHK